MLSIIVSVEEDPEKKFSFKYNIDGFILLNFLVNLILFISAQTEGVKDLVIEELLQATTATC